MPGFSEQRRKGGRTGFYLKEMKILADTNILIFALLWPIPNLPLLHAARHHELALCDRNIFGFCTLSG
jgi:hypothetical protein